MEISVSIPDKIKNVMKIELSFGLRASMLEQERALLMALNEAGARATKELLEQCDTDGSPIELGGVRWTSKGREWKDYRTPYGDVSVKRHVYQTAKGGKTFCPLEREARIVVTSTPWFAKQVAYKFAYGSSRQVRDDLAECHGRKMSRSCLQNLAEAVASVVQAHEENWHYTTPPLDKAVKTAVISIDGTCLIRCEGSFREAMVGTVSLYDRHGERQHTLYIAATPMYGRATFFERLEREIAQVRAHYPKATCVGVGDGAEATSDFLKRHTTTQILDFHHAVGYLAEAATAAVPRNEAEREEWFETRRQRLQQEHGAASDLLQEMEVLAQQSLSEGTRAALQRAIDYFRDHKHQMDYAQYRHQNLPIGSGVIEAACSTLVQRRICHTRKNWKPKGVATVLSLRALVLTKPRWDEFWERINKCGLPVDSPTM